jgi:hypothetical protein
LDFFSTLTGWFASRTRWFWRIVLFGGIGVAYFVFSVVKIYASIPALPIGPLQIVGASTDGARFILLDEGSRDAGKSKTAVLVVMHKATQTEAGAFRFEAKRETIDCAGKKITLDGAGFYNDNGEQTISRVFDGKAQAVNPIDTEVAFVCEKTKISAPSVVGYKAALQQEEKVVSGALGSP